MTNLHNINSLNKTEYAKTTSGSINYQHYDNRARDIRSVSVWKLLKSFFTENKTSSIDKSEECQVMTFDKEKTVKKLFRPLQEAA